MNLTSWAIYSWGGTTTSSLSEMQHAIHSHLCDRLTKGPGWVIEQGPDKYDIEIHVRITKRPKPTTRLQGSGT